MKKNKQTELPTSLTVSSGVFLDDYKPYNPKFKIFTYDDYYAIPKNMVLIKNKYGWLFLSMEKAQWFMNHTNTFNDKSKESDEEVIKAIVRQIKINAKLAKQK